MNNYFYVDYKTGKDSQKGTQEKPFRTIAKAINKATFSDNDKISKLADN
jgi:hypothetical protein